MKIVKNDKKENNLKENKVALSFRENENKKTYIKYIYFLYIIFYI